MLYYMQIGPSLQRQFDFFHSCVPQQKSQIVRLHKLNIRECCTESLSTQRGQKSTELVAWLSQILTSPLTFLPCQPQDSLSPLLSAGQVFKLITHLPTSSSDTNYVIESFLFPSMLGALATILQQLTILEKSNC
jgi:hypothetical protein